MTPEEILRDLARDDIFPKAAIKASRADPEAMRPIFVDIVRRLSVAPIRDMEDADVMALIPVLHLLAEWREASAYRPVLNLMRRPTKVGDYLLGDAITELSFRLVAGVFDGDLEPLFEAIEDPKADEFARSSLLSSLVLITQLHPEHRPPIEEFVRSFLIRNARPPEDVLTGWMEAVADLGLEDMTAVVRGLFDAGRISPDYCNFQNYLDDLQATLLAGGQPGNHRYQNALITDAIEELSKWHCYSDKYFAEKRNREVSNEFRVAPWTEAFLRPDRKIGRNDPCPCGSGKKFKKCCLH